MRHRLDPLLRPRAVAIVGASADRDSLGGWALTNLVKGHFEGPIHPVNPRYEKIDRFRCYASLEELPETPDLVIFAVSDSRLESVLDQAIAASVPAAVIMSSLVVDGDSEPQLKDRVSKKITEAGMLVCGANGMGFYNVRDKVWACGFDSREHLPPGNVSLISHSGSGMCGILDCEERLRFNFAVSCGNELSVAMDEYLDFVLELPETRVVGLFVETARNPAGFRDALAKAARREIPIVALKVGRTERSARLTISHSGALAGDDATYDALFERYGVQRVDDMDDLATTLIMFAAMHPVGNGGLVTLHDSGGERQLMVDLAEQASVPLTDITEKTVAALEAELDPELPAVNPLDAWSRGGPDAAETMTRCLSILMQDPGAAAAGLIHDRAPGGGIYRRYLQYMRRARTDSGKPVALVAARQGTGMDNAIVDSTHAGYAVLDGVSGFLRGVRCLFAYRDFLRREAMTVEDTHEPIVQRWRERLRQGHELDESESLEMLREFGMQTVPCVVAESETDALSAAEDLGYPLAIKSAEKGIRHKSDVGGIYLDIGDAVELQQAYRTLAGIAGPRVSVSAMAAGGIEMMLGARCDPQFGPVVIVGFGGIHAETINDVFFAMPPFDSGYVRHRLGELKLLPLLGGVRGRPAADVAAFCRAAASFSAMVHSLAGVLEEIDVNPVVVGANGCVAVDGLVLARDSNEQD